MQKAIVTGVPAVGKSTICRIVANNNKILMINFGEFLSNYIRNYGSEEGCDAAFLRYLSDLEQPAIVESHGVTKTKYGFKYIPFKCLDGLVVSCLVLIVASPVQIYKRRLLDKKVRQYETLNEIRMHQDLLKSEIIANSAITGREAYIIKNENLQDAVSGLEEALHDSGFF